MAGTSLWVLTSVLALLPAALGHGYMTNPLGRQVNPCQSPHESRIIIDAGTGGGDSPGSEYRGGYPSVCGDPFVKHPDYEHEDIVTAFDTSPCLQEPEVYTAGSEITIDWVLTANHMGFFQCSLCEDANALSEECFEQHPLLTVEHNSERWYIMEEEGEPLSRGTKFHMAWHLPAGVTCERCTVSCAWWTAHLCTYECDPEICGWYAEGWASPPGPNRKDQPQELCDSLYPAVGEDPQMFRNCGDIKIVPGDDGGPENPLPAAAPQPAPTPSPAPAVPAPETPGDGDSDAPEEGLPSSLARWLALFNA